MSSSSETLFVEDNHELSSNLSMRMEASTCTRSMYVGIAIGAGFTYPVDSGDHYTGCHPNVTLLVPEKLSCIIHLEGVRPARNSQDDCIYDLFAVSATKPMSQSLRKKNSEQIICCLTKSENMFAATKAQRRRKELMKIKNIQRCHVHSQGLNCWASVSSRSGNYLWLTKASLGKKLSFG